LLRTLEKARETAYVAVQDVDEGPSSVGTEGESYIMGFSRRRTTSDDSAYTLRNAVPASHVSGDSALCLWERQEPNFWDEDKTSPIFNYARSWGWADAVEEVATAFQEASDKARKRKPVNPDAKWVDATHKPKIDPANRTGSLNQVKEYCGCSSLNPADRKRIRAPGALTRAIIASFCGLALQWGTTVSSVLVLIYTPTVGLGCRSGAYLLYGILSTFVLLLMMISSVLNHYCSINSPDDTLHYPDARPTFNSISVALIMSNILRRTAVVVASANSVWILVTCVFQFADVFDTCYCNSSVLGLGSAKAYISIAPDLSLVNMKGFWIGSMVLGGGCIAAYSMFVALMVEPPASNSR